ncbi:Uncharacterised protein [Mycobacteroides abscessus subsp. abscessus]|nr:Uncharacterised protein [Mycobacteroides abscessus subsp. abscessus]SKV89241.1 Uncharacterised protein [Mycobacteroides abscessus subsp. abscessus]
MSADTTRILPSAVTTRAEISWSQVRPNLRVRTPTPPPRVSPAIPTVGQEPPASMRPAPAIPA